MATQERKRLKHLKSRACVDRFQATSLQLKITAPACKISGLKSAHIHACNGPISTFNTVHFYKKSFHVLSKGEKVLMISNLALLLVIFRMSARHA